MAEPMWLSGDEDRAWRGWMAMSGLLRAQIARDLQCDCGLSDSDYAVLAHLSETPGGRIRMTELAGALGWSKSRVSHQCSRMAGRGLLSREGCPEDARSAYAVLTGCGRREIERAAPLHVGSVRRHLIDLLDPAEVQALITISERVVAHLSAVGTGTEGTGTEGSDSALDCAPLDTPLGPPPVTLPPCPTRTASARTAPGLNPSA